MNELSRLESRFMDLFQGGKAAKSLQNNPVKTRMTQHLYTSSFLLIKIRSFSYFRDLFKANSADDVSETPLGRLMRHTCSPRTRLSYS